MEALAVLSVVSNGLQVIDFCVLLVSKASEIRKHGTPQTDAEIESIIANLRRMQLSLQVPGESSIDPVQYGPITEVNHDLIQKTDIVATEILALLNKVKRGSSSSPWSSVRKAFKSVLGRYKLQELCHRLTRLQDALQLHCVLNLKADVQVQSLLHDERNNEILAKYARVIQLIIQSTESARELSIRQAKTLLDRQIASEKMSHEHFEQTIAAIQQLPGRIKLKQTTAALEYHCTNEPAHAVRLAYIAEMPAEIPPQIAASARKLVLDNLRFRQMKLREVEIEKAHSSTFGWVFKEPDWRSWDSLTTWLRTGSGCYWINGKAASGKSTLMKFLARHRETTAALQHWADGKHLLILSFFFWYSSGLHLQRSQEGLYRSILYEVLSQHGYLIPQVFPELYAEEVSRQTQSFQPQSLSTTELKLAFLRLLDALPPSARVCLFIDGLDEYEGQHEDICELFQSIVHKTNLKVILSSRPIPACIEAFKNCQSLRLEDLTKDDIRKYVVKELVEQPRMLELEDSHPEEAKDLLECIVSRASGVFLWVLLVVKSLVAGLRDYDRISDLQRRLDEIPQELEAMYKHMLSSMKPLYQCQASQMFQVLLRYTELGFESPLNILQMSWAEEDDPMSTIKLSDKGLNRIQIERRIYATHKRMISRCCGLIEVSGILKPDAHVNFLHKTVADFLRQPNMQQYLLQLTQESNFDIHIAILSSSLAMLKLARQDWQWRETVILADDKELRPIISHVKKFFHHCTNAQHHSDHSYSPFVRDCDRVMSRGWSHVTDVEKIKPCLKDHNGWPVVMTLVFPSDRYQFVHSIIGLAAIHNLEMFISEEAPNISDKPENGVLPQLLEQVILDAHCSRDLSHANSGCEVIKSLVKWRLVYSNDDKIINRALELAMYYFVQAVYIEEDSFFPDWQIMATKMAIEIVNCGANPNIRIRGKVYSRYSTQAVLDERSVLCVVEDALATFQKKRGVSVHYLIADVTALINLLRRLGGISSAWLDGQVVTKFFKAHTDELQFETHHQKISRANEYDDTIESVTSQHRLGRQPRDPSTWVCVEEQFSFSGCISCLYNKKYMSKKDAITHLRMVHFPNFRRNSEERNEHNESKAKNSILESEEELHDEELAKYVASVAREYSPPPRSSIRAISDRLKSQRKPRRNPATPPMKRKSDHTMSDHPGYGGLSRHNPNSWGPSAYDTYTEYLLHQNSKATQPSFDGFKVDGNLRPSGIYCVHHRLRHRCELGCGFVFEPSAR